MTAPKKRPKAKGRSRADIAARATAAQAGRFLDALRKHQEHEDRMNAARESRAVKRMQTWMSALVGRVETAVGKVTQYQTSIAHVWETDTAARARHRAKVDDHETRISELEKWRRSKEG